MNRYVIMARENYPGAQIREICRTSSYPKDIRNALADYTVTGSQGTRIHKYNHVEILTITRHKTVAQMKKPKSNVKPFAQSEHMVKNLLVVFGQIDAMRADDGEQTAQGPAAQARPPLQIGQPEEAK
jgi:hypothetical protein